MDKASVHTVRLLLSVMNAFNLMSVLAQTPLMAPPAPILQVPIGGVTLIFSIIAALIVVSTMYWWRLRIFQWLQDNPFFRAAFYVGDAGLLVALGWLVSGMDLTKASTWKSPPTEFTFLVPFCVAIFVSAIAVKVILAWTKDKEKARIAQLGKELEALTSEIANLKSDRNQTIRFANQIRNLIERKLKGIRAMAEKIRAMGEKQSLTFQEYLNVWDRQVEIHTILKSIHEFFHAEIRQINPNAKLRLALYIPSSDMKQLDLLLSWDGQDEGCVAQHSEAIELVSPDGIKSLIAETFHLQGDWKLSVIPDCSAEGAAFRFFSTEERTYLRSMIAFKYKALLNGTPSALVLSLDTDEPNFFSAQKTEALTSFLVEMMKRFEYELLDFELTKKITAKSL